MVGDLPTNANLAFIRRRVACSAIANSKVVAINRGKRSIDDETIRGNLVNVVFGCCIAYLSEEVHGLAQCERAADDR